jgi:hypothetical protein
VIDSKIKEDQDAVWKRLTYVKPKQRNYTFDVGTSTVSVSVTAVSPVTRFRKVLNRANTNEKK